MNVKAAYFEQVKGWFLKWPLHPLVQGGCGFFALLIIILGVFQRGPEVLKYPATFLLIYSLMLAVFWIGISAVIEKFTWLHKPFIFPVAVTGLAFVPRYLWIRLVETTPMWDFARYYHYAISIVNGNPEAIADIRGVFPHLTGYPLILSYVFRFFGTEVAIARWFNLICTLLTVLLVYQLGKVMFSPKAGRIAAIIVALWPGQIFYISVLAAEHLFTMQLLFVLLLFCYMVKGESSGKSFGWAVATGAMLTMAHIVRPVASLLFPAFFLYLLMAPALKESVLPNEIEGKPGCCNKKVLLRRASLLAVIVLIFLGTLQGLNRIYEPQVQVPLGKTGAGFNLYVGTNKDSQGMWSAEDWEIIEEFHYDFDRIHQEAWNRGIERIQEDYTEFLLLAEQKFSIQWAVSEYGLYWGLLETDRVTAVSLWAEEYRQELQIASQVFYLSLFWLILINTRKEIKKFQATPADLIGILFFGFIAMHTLIEVQSRYHHSLIPLFILLAVGQLKIEKIPSLKQK